MKKLFRANLLCLLSCLLLAYFTGCSRRSESTSAENKPAVKSAAILVSSAGRDAAEPAIAAAPDGSLYVVWVEHGPEKEANIFIRHFGSEQKPLSEAVRVNLQGGEATAWRGDPPTVKVDADGIVYVGWTKRIENPAASANDLLLSVSRDGGKTFEAPVKVNDDTLPAAHGMHSLEVDKSGRVYFAWLDERYLKKDQEMPPMEMNKPGANSNEMQHSHSEPNREVYFAVSTDHGKSFAANKKIAENVCPCCKTSIATGPDGRLYVSWRQVLDDNFRHIAVVSSIDGGNIFTTPVIVSDDRWQLVACPVSGAPMAVDPENNLKIFWYTAGAAGAPGIYEAESKDGGKTFSPRILVSDQGGAGTPVVMQNTAGKLRLAFAAAAGQSLYLLTARNATDDFTPPDQITDADLPGAALSNDKIFVAFIRKNGEQRNIFLQKQN